MTTTSLYPHTPVLRHINVESVDALGPWARVIHDMIMNAKRERSRWERAAFTAAEAEGVKNLSAATSPAAKRAIRTRSSLNKTIERLEMGLALEIAGRDLTHLGDEIVNSCFTKGKAHKAETLVNRLFKTKGCYIGYEWVQYVERVISKLVKADRLRTRTAERTYDTMYYVVTPEIIAEEKKAAEDRAKAKARRAVEKARQKAVIDMLKAQGYESARAESYHHSKVTVSVSDLEKLLGLAS
jgi:hypothetical protein